MDSVVRITIKGELPGMNEYIKAMNSHRHAGAKMKKESTEIVRLYSFKYKNHKLKAPFYLEFHWYCKDKKKDKDNVAFAKKFILDGLQLAGVLPQDTWKAIDGFSDSFEIDAKNPRIEIVIV